MIRCQAVTVQGHRCKKSSCSNDQGYCRHHSNDSKKRRVDREVDIVVDNQCSKMIKDGQKYTRCLNARGAGKLVCLTHTVNPQAAEMWVPAPLPIEEKKAEINPQCSACKFEPSGNISRCTNISTPRSKAGKYCSAHKHAYRLDFDVNCPICIEPNDESKNVPLECGHLFHSECLRKWNKPNCPSCRGKMNTEETARYIVVTPVINTDATVRNIVAIGARLMTRIASHMWRISSQEVSYGRDQTAAMVIRNFQSLSSMIPDEDFSSLSTNLRTALINDPTTEALMLAHIFQLQE
jgi:hypothetical protein